jgi:hypothetical protein
VFVLAFAIADSNGNYRPVWDPSITPQVVAQVQSSDPPAPVWASLGGGNSPWIPPSNQQTWINNATTSLVNLINTYHLDGLDVDYENGAGDPSFPSVMNKVIENVVESIPGRRPGGMGFSYSPYGQTAATYNSLYKQWQFGGIHPFIHYQAYDGGQNTVQAYQNLYTNLASQYGGYGQLGLGIDSNPKDHTSTYGGLYISNPPGNPPDITTVATDLSFKGVNRVSIWSLEGSLANGYPIEKALLLG